MARKVFGRIEKLPSGRYRARHPNPTPGSAERIPAPSTFSTKGAAQTWLNTRQDAIAGGTWVHPDDAAVARQATQAEDARKAVAFGVYAEKWVATRTNSTGEPLRPCSYSSASSTVTKGVLRSPILGQRPLISLWRSRPPR